MACVWLETWYRRLIVILFTCSREFYTSTAQILSIPHDSCYVFVLVSSAPSFSSRVRDSNQRPVSLHVCCVWKHRQVFICLAILLGPISGVWKLYGGKYTHTHHQVEQGPVHCLRCLILWPVFCMFRKLKRDTSILVPSSRRVYYPGGWTSKNYPNCVLHLTVSSSLVVAN